MTDMLTRCGVIIDCNADTNKYGIGFNGWRVLSLTI